MDPDMTLAHLREACKQVSRMEEEDIDPILEAMVELFEGLDQWLSRRGFLPKDWNQASTQ